MTCPRCQGLMVSITLDDPESSPLGEPILGWRCLLCGEVVDETIVANRKSVWKPERHRHPICFPVLAGVAAGATRKPNSY